MEKIRIMLLFMVVLFIFSCKKTEIINSKAGMKLTYEVITSSGNWFGEYNDKEGKRVYSAPIEQPNGWKYEIIQDKFPFTMFLNATSSCVCLGTETSPDVTINFYVDGKIVKTQKNNWAKGVTSIEYKVG